MPFELSRPFSPLGASPIVLLSRDVYKTPPASDDDYHHQRIRPNEPNGFPNESLIANHQEPIIQPNVSPCGS